MSTVIVIHTPHKCQNGHDNILATVFGRGSIFEESWVKEVCSCPKHEMDEGYSPSGDSYVVSGLISLLRPYEAAGADVGQVYVT